jgi:sugar diacid utilization regulator
MLRSRQLLYGGGVWVSTPPGKAEQPGQNYRNGCWDVPRGQFTGFRGLIALSSLMFGSHEQDEILRLLDRGVPELVSAEVEACYLRTDGRLVRKWPISGADRALGARVARLGPDGGEIEFGEGVWRWAFPLTSTAALLGYLILRCAAEPPAGRRFLMEALAQQTAAAVANASQVAELLRVNDDLSATVAYLEQRTAVHEVLTRVSASGKGEAGIARAVHELTGLPVAIEDAFGNLRQSSGLAAPDDYPTPPAAMDRQVFLNQLSAHEGPLRERGRIVSLVRPRSDVLGVLVLLDREHSAAGYETFVAEYATTVLALELAHQRSLAEVELRVHRDLVDDLIEGTDEESAFARAAAIGHDLHAPHHVVAVRWTHQTGEGAVVAAARRVVQSWQRRTLVSRHSGVVVLLIDGPVDGGALYKALATQLEAVAGAIGVGGQSSRPADLPRSYAQAMQALGIREESASPHGATSFDALGLYRILDVRHNRATVESFLRQWLGPLLDYDDQHHSQLVRTLFEYLEHGGHYDSAAAALVIHRSTLRYRLTRIREVAGLDLTDVDTRLNLQVATRAWQLLRSEGPSSGP